MAKNRLLFSTPRGGVFLRPGSREWLTGRHRHGHHHDHHHHGHHDNRGISIREFETIRVVANNRGSSSSVVSIVLLVSGRERDGGRRGRDDRGRDHHSQQFILDRIRLAPGESVSRSYRVPGETLNIVAIAREGRRGGCCRRRRGDVIDVAVFGHK